MDSKMGRPDKSAHSDKEMVQNGQNNTPEGHKGFVVEGTNLKIPHIDYCSHDHCLIKHIASNPTNFNPYYVNSSLLRVCQFQPSTRSKMVLWFIEESSNQFLPRIVCSKAISLLDWFLMKRIKIGIDKLQQLGIACLGLAWKMNQSGVGIIPVDEGNFSKASIKNFEKKILGELQYRVEGPTYVSIALELLNCWDRYVKNLEEVENSLPIYLQKIRDDVCHDLAAVLRIDEFFTIVDLSSSVLEFLDYPPQDVIFNILFYFVTLYKYSPAIPPISDNDLLRCFDDFSRQIPQEGFFPIGDMIICEKLQKKIGFIYGTFLKERQLLSEKNCSYRDEIFLQNYFVQFCVKEAKEINLDDNYEKMKKRKIIRKGRKPMNLLETIANIQISKPYYNKIARSLLKNMQCL